MNIIFLLTLERWCILYKPLSISILNTKTKLKNLLYVCIFSFILNVSDFIDYRVICKTYCDEVINNDIIDEDCHLYYIQFHESRNNLLVGYIWWLFRLCFGLILPVFSILLMNILLIIRLTSRRRSNCDIYSSTMWTTIYISISFLICFFPITFHALFFYGNITLCSGPPHEELFRMIANILLTLSNVIYSVIIVAWKYVRNEI